MEKSVAFILNDSIVADKTVTDPVIAIVIDDFGLDRGGVYEMLKIQAPLTCAIMPNLYFSHADANMAHERGYEVILHMPMEADVSLPLSWYGPQFIKNSDTPEKAVKLLKECIKAVPHIKGVNMHIGSGVSRNKEVMSAIYKEVKKEGLFFLDSYTTLSSSCNEVATLTGNIYLKRDVFLESTSYKSVELAKSRLAEAVGIAKHQGYCICIGHVGPVGGWPTAKAIEESLSMFKNEGVRLVKVSELYEKLSRSRVV